MSPGPPQSPAPSLPGHPTGEGHHPSHLDNLPGARAPLREPPWWWTWIVTRFLYWEATLSRIPRELIRWKFFFWTLGAAAALLTAALIWHRIRLSKSAGELLESARLEHRTGDAAKAAKLFDAYLKLFPNELAVRIERARAFDQQAVKIDEKLRALELYQQALAAKKDLAAINSRMAQMEFEMGRDDKALMYAEAALADEPQFPLAWKYKALAQARRYVKQPSGDATESLTSLETAAQLLPEDIEVVGTCAGAMRRDGAYWSTPATVQKADALMDKLVGLRPTDPLVWMARYAYRFKFNIPDASGDLDEALAFAPDDLETLLAFARDSRRSGNLLLAKNLFTKAVEVSPASGRAHLGLAQTTHEQGAKEQAIELARQGLKGSDGDPWITLQLCEWLIEKGDLEQGNRMLDELGIRVEKATEGLPPPQVQALKLTIRFLAGQTEMKRKNYSAAVEQLKPLVIARPNTEQTEEAVKRSIQIHLCLAECYVALEDWVQAGNEFDAASALTPQATGPVLAAAQAWERVLPERAIQRYERVLSLDPSQAKARKRLGELRRAINPGSGG